MRVAIMLTGASLLVACPPSLDVPSLDARMCDGPPAANETCACQSDDECNESSCGLLRACITGICAEDATILVPCEPGG